VRLWLWFFEVGPSVFRISLVLCNNHPLSDPMGMGYIYLASNICIYYEKSIHLSLKSM